MLRSLIVSCLITAAAFAQSPTPALVDAVRIRMPEAEMSDFIKFYQALSKRKVWIDAQLRFDRRMTLLSDHDVSRAEAISLLRDALLKEGVEIREVGDSEAYVSHVAP